MSGFTFEDYEREAKKVAIYPEMYIKGYRGEYKVVPAIYTTIGLVGEAGEFANKVKKVIRDTNGDIDKSLRDDLQDELGDILWYCAQAARDLGFTLESVARQNNHKLKDRHLRGVIGGKGDHR